MRETGWCAALAAVLFVGCPGGGHEVVSSHAYKGHENDRDAINFVNVYPRTVGTRLDDCQTCHRSATLAIVASTKTAVKNTCDYCHLVNHPAADLVDQPTSFADTLNEYGAAYLAAGRTRAALSSIADADSDGDGHANAVEIADLKYPGDATSKPGQQSAPQRVFHLGDLQALAAHTEFLLANSTKQQYDEYASYTGVKVKDLLAAAGVDLADTEIEGVTVVAPDGFMKSISIANVTTVYPTGVFHAGLDTATLGPTCGFVTYPATLPEGIVDGGDIPGEQWLELAYAREGAVLDTSNLDPTSGKINGEGPFRLVVPQRTPGWPDRGSQYSPTTCGDGRDFDSTANHNAGDMVRGVVGIRVDPLPAGYEDFDYRNGGWAYIEDGSVFVYGHGVVP